MLRALIERAPGMTKHAYMKAYDFGGHPLTATLRCTPAAAVADYSTAPRPIRYAGAAAAWARCHVKAPSAPNAASAAFGSFAQVATGSGPPISMK